MSLTSKCLYNKNHLLSILYRNTGKVDERVLNLTITEIEESLEIKIRDSSEHCFNFTENIDLGDFEVMRVDQNLDINFCEFRCNLIEMLHQLQGKEMFLKCEVLNEICTLVFYGKSKIKAIIFLTIDLHLTNQKEILAELIGNLQEIQEFNDKLKKQLANLKKCVSDKDQQIKHLEQLKIQLEKQFINNLKQLEDLFHRKLKETDSILVHKMLIMKNKISKFLLDINNITKAIGLNSQNNQDLLEIIKKLRLESSNNTITINQLKLETNSLHAEKMKYESVLVDLKTALQEKELSNGELQRKNNELRVDLERATIILAQKNSTIDELSQDLLQANQMLVNFNKHYDEKIKRMGELESTIHIKDKIINEQNLKFQQFLTEFEDYKSNFNDIIQNELKYELSLAKSKIDELEKSIRKANKINTLLTERVNHQNGFQL